MRYIGHQQGSTQMTPIHGFTTEINGYRTTIEKIGRV
jgi:hypothetical protein